MTDSVWSVSLCQVFRPDKDPVCVEDPKKAAEQAGARHASRDMRNASTSKEAPTEQDLEDFCNGASSTVSIPSLHDRYDMAPIQHEQSSEAIAKITLWPPKKLRLLNSARPKYFQFVIERIANDRCNNR